MKEWWRVEWSTLWHEWKEKQSETILDKNKSLKLAFKGHKHRSPSLTIYEHDSWRKYRSQARRREKERQKKYKYKPQYDKDFPTTELQ